MINGNANVEEIWYQEPGDGVAECVSIRVAGGPKRYMRVWPAAPSVGIEWGWSLSDAAVQIYPPPMPEAAVPLVEVHERRNGWCDTCGGTGADGVDHIDVYSEPKPCTPVPCPSFEEVRMALVPRLDPPTVAELRQAGAAIYRVGDTFWSLRDGAVVVIDMAGNVVVA